MKSMMCCSYPTTTVIIDDDSAFLKIIEQHIGLLDLKTFSSPNLAIEHLNTQNPTTRLLHRIIKNDQTFINYTSSPDDQFVQYNLKGLLQEIYNPNRFNDVSVIVIDYCMDEMSGIAVCEALANHPAKKILLTGSADMELTAIDAFNKGIIDRFVSKSDPLFASKIQQSIATCKEDYFRDLSETLTPYLSSLSHSLYQHPTLINFTRNIYNELNIIEHYLIDAAGTRLMLDADGNASWIIIKHEADMQNIETIAHDQDAPPSLIHGIKNRILIPFFLSDDDFHQPVTEWERFSYEGKSLPFAKDYYYAIYSCNQSNHIIHENIVSYNSFRNANGCHQ